MPPVYETRGEYEQAQGEDGGGGADVFIIEDPHVSTGWGIVGYESASNALFFVAEHPVTTVAF